MKKYRLLLLSILLALVGRILADNLTIETITMEPGETKQVAISLNNPQKTYSAFQFDLTLPKGISIATKDDKYIAVLDDNRKANHSLKVSQKSEGVYRLMAYSMSSAVFDGTNGPLVYVTLHADPTVATGTKKGTLEEQVLTESNGSQNYLDDISFSIIVSLATSLKGDVNNDGLLTDDDLIALIRYIIGRNPSPFNMAAAYVNDDDKIDIADVAALIRIIGQ